MKAFIYRITVSSLLIVFWSNTLPAQGIVSPHQPVCGFEGMNHQLCQEDPQLEKETRDFLQKAVPELSAQNRSVIEPILTISVVVHIIHSGEPIGQGSNISDQQVVDQIAILSDDFQGLNSQFYNTPARWEDRATPPNIQFLLATVDPNGNPTNGITRHNIPVTGTSWNNNNINSEIKPATKWAPNRYFNIYVVAIPGTTAAGGVVGYSNYPTPSLIGADRDGPVIDYRWFGGPGHPVSGWRPITHETGHFLGLPHTFAGSSCNSDDGIADTPNAADATSEYVTLDCAAGYPTGPTSCSEEHLYVNYMDYVDENCYTSFTQGQVNVMRSVLDGTSSGFGYGSREELITNAPSQTIIPENDAGITRLVSPEQNNCTPDELVPTVTLRNFGSATLTESTIHYQVDNGPLIDYNWQGSLFPGETVDVTLPPFTPPDGQYTLTFATENPNGEADDRSANDEYSIGMFTYFAFDPPMMELAEGTPVLPTPLGTYQFNFGEDDFKWEISNEASSYGYGLGAFLFDNRAGTTGNNPSDTYDLLITRHFDFTEVNAAALYFDVAYATYNPLQIDTLYVLISTGCTQNFNLYVYKKWGNDLATAPPTQSPFIPMPEQWRTEGIDLSYFDGMDDVTIGFLNVSNWGNRLYLDNIRVGVDCGTVTAEWEITPNGCNNPPGVCNGAATVNVPVSNGMVAYEWEGWPNNINEPTLTGLCEGNVQVTITDEFGCQLVTSNEIPQAAATEIALTSTDETGYESSDGSATATVLSGEAPFTYSWSNGTSLTTTNFSHTVNNLPSGTYAVTVTDSGSCTTTLSVLVESVCTGFNINLTSENITCSGLSDGSTSVTTVNGTAPFSYSWSNGFSGQTNDCLSAGSYSVTVIDTNGCPLSSSVVISEPSALTATISSTDVSASGALDGTATVIAADGTPSYSYHWNTGASTATISNLSPGVYTVTVTDANGCTLTGSTTVQSVGCTGLNVTIDATDITCFGSINGSVGVSVQGATPPITYNWSNGESGVSIEGLGVGNYTVTVVDGAGCSSELSATVQEPLPLNLGLSSTNESSTGANNGTATVTPSGGVPFAGGVYQYLWSNGGTSATITGLSAGGYSVTVTDFNGCTAIGSVVVSNVNCQLAITMDSQNASCPNVADGSASVTLVSNGTAPFSFLWSNGQTTATIENLLPNNYTVTVSDANGCTANGWIPISGIDLTPPTLELISPFTINLGNGTYLLDPVALDNGSYDNCSMVNLELSKMEFDCNDIGEMDVTVTATDATGNQNAEMVRLVIKDGLAPEITCPDDISIDDCDVVDYQLPVVIDNCGLEALVLTAGLPSGSIFPPGETMVVYESIDIGGNTSTCSFLVDVNYDFFLGSSLVQPPLCAGTSTGSIEINIQGGQSPYEYVWSHGSEPNNLPAGQYSVSISDDNGCLIVAEYELIDPPVLLIELLDITPAMGGIQTGSINLLISGGSPDYETQWFENGDLLPGFDPFFAPPGSYTTVVSDANGCTAGAGPFMVDNLNTASSGEFEQSISFFPNPSSGEVVVALNMAFYNGLEISIFDLTGKGCHFDQLQSYETVKRMNLNHLNQGIYWVKFLSGTEMAWKKLIIL